MDLGFDVWDVAGPVGPADIGWAVGNGQLNSVTIRHGDEVHQMPTYSTVSVAPALAERDSAYVERMAALGAAEYLARVSGRTLDDVSDWLGGFGPFDFQSVTFEWAEATSPGQLADLGHGVRLLLPSGPAPRFCVVFRSAELPSIVSAAPDMWPVDLVGLVDRST